LPSGMPSDDAKRRARSCSMLPSEYRLESLFFANRGVLFDGVGLSGTGFAKHRCF
jgi:hypothetical protein